MTSDPVVEADSGEAPAGELIGYGVAHNRQAVAALGEIRSDRASAEAHRLACEAQVQRYPSAFAGSTYEVVEIRVLPQGAS